MAMFGRQPAFGLKSLNIPDEVIASIETEDDLMEVLGTENNVEEDIIEQEVPPTDDEIQLVSVIAPEHVKRITVNARKTTNFVIQGAIKPVSVA